MTAKETWMWQKQKICVKTKELCTFVSLPQQNKNGNDQNLRGLRNETTTVNYVSFHLELNAALICYDAVNLWR